MERDYLEQTKDKKVDLVVCSDAQAILGIGDQGVGVNILVYFIYVCCWVTYLQGIGVGAIINLDGLVDSFPDINCQSHDLHVRDSPSL